MPPTIELWRWSLDPPPPELDEFWAMLSAEERTRADRFHFPAHRRRFIAAHGRLREILGERAAADPATLRFGAHPQGKPFLIGPGEDLHFNLSHAHEIAILGVSTSGPLGVDVEHIRPVTAGLAERYFAPAEAAALQTAPVAQRQHAFFRIWTRKEAYIKAIGMGLQIPLDSFEVSLGQPAHLLLIKDQPGEAANWRFLHLCPAPGYVGAVAMRHPEWKESFQE